MLPISLRPLFALMDRIVAEEQNARREQARPSGPCTALDRHMERSRPQNAAANTLNGITRIQLCRRALAALDRRCGPLSTRANVRSAR